jgi:hypothetical protein
MQVMTWPVARLGSRFSLLMEPQRRRTLHSALGRFFDQPLDLAVGLVEPDGTERVLPLCAEGEVLYGVEQFERINSITYRGHSERFGLRFELNIHSPFYPQNEKLCVMPVFYLELRLTSIPRVRLRTFQDQPKRVRVFFRLARPQTRVDVAPGRIDLQYDVPLDPRYSSSCGSDRGDGCTDGKPPAATASSVAHAVERIHSLNEGATPDTDSQGRRGLTLEMPVTEEGSGTKWRLVWCAHTADPVLEVRGSPARFRYNKYWPDLDSVMTEAISSRDSSLALSRRFEKLVEQAPLSRARWHLMVMAFQSYLSNSFWCDCDGLPADKAEFFSVWEGNFMYHNTLDVGYNIALFYLVLWPRLLRLCFDTWAEAVTPHLPSGGAILNHDIGQGVRVLGVQQYQPMPVEENSDFLLLMQAYAHWTGDLTAVNKYAEVIRLAAAYLLWTDRDNSGFPSEGNLNTLDDASPALHSAKKQTYLAVKRATALDAAGDLLARTGDREAADECRSTAAAAVPKIEREAWLGEHYAVCLDGQADAVLDADTGEVIGADRLAGWDDYSIYTANGLLLPLLTAQPIAFDRANMHTDLINAQRESMLNYGCGHTSSDHTNIWLSQNLWRDFTSRYLHADLLDLNHRYWDMLVFSNTGGQSFGYIDTYLGNELAFNPRGAVSFGYFLGGPRLVIDRLDTEYIAVDPDRGRPERWPLLPLADWDAGKIPICVVHEDGSVTIEGEIAPVRIVDRTPRDEDTIG